MLTEKSERRQTLDPKMWERAKAKAVQAELRRKALLEEKEVTGRLHIYRHVGMGLPCLPAYMYIVGSTDHGAVA